MAGDWIKMRTSLLTSPKVNGIARILEGSNEVARALTTGFSGVMSDIVTRNVMRNVTVSSLLIVWGAANEHTDDGIFINADLHDIDDMVGIPGFGAAMVAVGWAEHDAENDRVILPNFSEYNTCGKDRAAEKNAERQRRYRERHKASGDENGNVTRNVTNNGREEKSREEERKTPSESKETAPASPAQPPKPKSAKGARLPADWLLPKAWGEWAVEESGFSPERVRAIAEKFADHWHAKAGREACKADWLATWRNWIREEIARSPRIVKGRPVAAADPFAGAI